MILIIEVNMGKEDKRKILDELMKKVLDCKCDITKENFIYQENSNTSYYVRPSHINNLCLSEIEFKKYEKYFLKGRGGELTIKPSLGNNCKMQSLGSSSAMIVNILGRRKDNELLLIKDNEFGIPKGEYYVSFERKLRTLNDKVRGSRNSPAHVDGFLLSKDNSTVILIESKMLEYLEKSSEENKKSYLDENNYYFKGKEFVDCYKKCETLFENLDYQQLIQHILGFYNSIKNPNDCFYIYDLNNENLKNIKNVYLLNVVWKMTDKTNLVYKIFEPYWNKELPDEKEIETMHKLLTEITKDAFDLKDIKFLSFDQFITIINDEDRKDYLERYFI